MKLQNFTSQTQLAHKRTQSSVPILPAPAKSFQTSPAYSQFSALTNTFVSHTVRGESCFCSLHRPAHRIPFRRRRKNLKNMLEVTWTHQPTALQVGRAQSLEFLRSQSREACPVPSPADVLPLQDVIWTSHSQITNYSHDS